MTQPGGNKAVTFSNPYASCKSKKRDIQPNNDERASSNDDTTTTNDAMMVISSPTIHSQTNSKSEPMELLEKLQRDYEALGKRSVKACLRSKTFPCQETKNALEMTSLLKLSVLQETYQILLENKEYLGSYGQQTDPMSLSSLGYMTRLGTLIRFLQLLLVVKHPMTPQETTPMILGLFKSLVNSVEKSLQYWNEDEQQQEQNSTIDDDGDLYSGDVSEFYHAPQVATFVLAFLLRIKSVILKYRPDLLPALWKSIDSIFVALGSNEDVPLELLQDCIDALGGYLREFLCQSVGSLVISNSGAATQQQQQQQAMQPQQLKLCSFFMSKLSSFFKLVSVPVTELDKRVVQDSLSILLCFCGLATSATQMDHIPPNFSSSLQKMASKAVKCLLSFLLTELTSHDGSSVARISLPNRSNLVAFLAYKSLSQGLIDGQNPSTKESLQLLDFAFQIGKTQLLQEVLQQCLSYPKPQNDDEPVPELWTEEENVDILLACCEHLLFRGLPSCHTLFISTRLKNKAVESCVPTKLLDNSRSQISEFLFLCETTAPCMTTNSDRGAASLHRLLLRWLLPISPVNNSNPEHAEHHPLTRECLLSTVHMHATRLYKDSNKSNGSREAGTPLLALLVKALLDHRISTNHRATIAALIRQMLRSESADLSLALRQLLCTEYSTKRPLRSRKRKHRKSPKDEGEADLTGTWHLFSLEDMLLIGSVIARLPFAMVPNSHSDLERFCLDFLPNSHVANARPTRPRQSCPRLTILTLSLLEAATREDLSVCLQKVAGENGCVKLQHRVCLWFLSLWNAYFPDERKHIDNHRMGALATVGRSVIRFISFASSETSSENQPPNELQEYLPCVLQVLDRCTDPDRILPLCRGNVLNAADNGASTASLVMEAARAIGVVGKAILRKVGGAEGIHHSFVEIFQRLLGHEACWSLNAQTITSLHEFSMSLSRTHRHILPTCIPERQKKGVTKLLQSRVQGIVYRYEKHRPAGDPNKRKATKESNDSIIKQCCQPLSTLVMDGSTTTKLSSSLGSKGGLPLSSGDSMSISVAAGSFFMSMPTQEGRKAVVIFPPDESSLEDIQYMLLGSATQQSQEDGDAESFPVVQQMVRAASSQDGSCKFRLKPFPAKIFEELDSS